MHLDIGRVLPHQVSLVFEDRLLEALDSVAVAALCRVGVAFGHQPPRLEARALLRDL